ncbi:uncharacterized protein [Oryza sativa Japonica Group]|uniref:uncharacterized protein isoform X2 n=1 Tax=Oryza sativa subsp. japonica TaxID=39947 RepID=UPI00339C55A9
MGSATKLKQINLGQQNLKVFGRLIRLWDAKNMASASTPTIFNIDGVILDEEGTMVQFTIPKKLENEFRPSLTLGCVYMFVDVNTVDIKNKKYIYHHQKYMLQFKSSTKVHHLESRGSSIPNYGFEFCPFDQIPSKSGISKPLIDLIGVISHVGPYDYAGKTSSKKNRKLKIRSKDEQEQEIVLWGEYGGSFDEAFVLQKSTDHKIVVAILAGLTAGTYLGKTEATSSSATQIYFDSDITEIAEYQSSYQWDIPTLQQQMPRVEHLTPLQAAGKLYKLEEISRLPISAFEGGNSYSCIAKVSAIVPYTNWYYKICKSCTASYNSNSDTPRCQCQHSMPKPMYKLPLTIKDESGTLDAVAFYNVAEDLVEVNATQATQNLKIDATEHAIALDIAIGKTRLFHIAMNTKYSSHFTINYVLKKSYPVENENTSLILPTLENTKVAKESATKQLATDEGLTTMEHCSKEDQHPTTPPSLQPPETTLDNNTVNQIIPSAKRALQFEKELHIDQPSPAIANTIQVATNQLYHPQQVDLSKEKQPSTEFSPGQNSKCHKKVTETSTNGEENQLQQPKIADQQPSGHKEQEP